jgi:hypothetical protein
LRYAENDLRTCIQQLAALLDRARDSHEKLAAATGLYQSGALEQWHAEWEADRSVARSLEEQLPDPSADYQSFAHSALEAKLVAVHALKSKAAHLQEKYRAVLAVDDKRREELRTNMTIDSRRQR